jgi:hypothetical protein
MPDRKSSFEHPLVQAERAVREAEARLKRQQQILADIKEHHVPCAAVAAQLVVEQAEQLLRARCMDLSCLQSRQSNR